tara:strand:- start:949 stop:1956 length:1008 start_codon:yes stop_codon:yes gene_type:complete
MKKGLITGGCGFIGSNLAHKLVEEGWIVDVVDDMSTGKLSLLEGLKMRVIPAGLLDVFYSDLDSKTRNQKEVHVIQGDFSNPRVLQNISDKKYDVVFHQAAIPRVSFSVENPSLTTDVNVSSTVRLFEACAKNVERVVFASSSSVYGGADKLPTSEECSKSPKSPYAWQKSTIEDFSKMCWDLYSLDIVCLRYFNVFGPGQYGDSPYSTAVSAWCHSAKNRTPCRSDGDGTQSRDMCYVDNIVHANILAANASMKFMGNTYNIACGDRTSNNDILNYFKNRFEIEVDNAPWRPGDVMHTQADISKARQDLGYEPLVRFWEGLERTIEWWNINGEN